MNTGGGISARPQRMSRLAVNGAWAPASEKSYLQKSLGVKSPGLPEEKTRG